MTNPNTPLSNLSANDDVAPDSYDVSPSRYGNLSKIQARVSLAKWLTDHNEAWSYFYSCGFLGQLVRQPKVYGLKTSAPTETLPGFLSSRDTLALVVEAMSWEQKRSYVRELENRGAVHPQGHDGTHVEVMLWQECAPQEERVSAILTALGLDAQDQSAPSQQMGALSANERGT
jgi:hypothetical protein